MRHHVVGVCFEGLNHQVQQLEERPDSTQAWYIRYALQNRTNYEMCLQVVFLDPLCMQSAIPRLSIVRAV